MACQSLQILIKYSIFIEILFKALLMPLCKIVVIETSYLNFSIIYTIIYFKDRNIIKVKK